VHVAVQSHHNNVLLAIEKLARYKQSYSNMCT
jgi:hypothetical protein